jgi:hypothetical protein
MKSLRIRALLAGLACFACFSCSSLDGGSSESLICPDTGPGDHDIEVRIEPVTAMLGLPCWMEIEVRNSSPTQPLLLHSQLSMIRSQGIAKSETPQVALAPRWTLLSYLPVSGVYGRRTLEPGERHRWRILLTRDVVFLAEGSARIRIEFPYQRPRADGNGFDDLWSERGREAPQRSTVVTIPVVTPSPAVESRVMGQLMAAFFNQLDEFAEEPLVPSGEAAEILVTLASDRRLPEFRTLASHPQARVRMFAMGAFASMPTGAGLGDLQAGVLDADETVSCTAIRFLTDLKIPVNEAGVATVFAREFPEAQYQIWQNLTEFRHPDVKDRLKELTRHSDPRIAELAEYTLEKVIRREAEGWYDER